jgi:hypothetical protein
MLAFYVFLSLYIAFPMKKITVVRHTVIQHD